MKNNLLIVALTSLTFLCQPLTPAIATNNDITTKTDTPTASQTTPITKEYLEAKLILPILKKTPIEGVQYDDATLALFCNMPLLSTIGKGMGASILIAFLALSATLPTNDFWGCTNSSSIEHRGIKCVAVTAFCVSLGAASAYVIYRILKDTNHKIQAHFSSIPLLAFSPEGIAVWGEQLANWDTIGSIEPFEQVEGLSGVFEPVPTVCIYNTDHQCLMVLPQALLPLPAAQIVELASTYKSLYQTASPAAH